VTNAFNFMDGLNGIASAQAIVAGVVLAALLSRHGDTAGAALAVAVAAAALGFLPWNLPSGSIFMGDIGSASLGLVLAVLVLRASSAGTSFIAAALVLAPFLADTGCTLLRRIRRRERLTVAHRNHYYQRLNQSGWSHASVTAVWSGLAVVSATAGFLLDLVSPALQLGVLLVLGLLYLSLFAMIDRKSAAAARQVSRESALE
jgi:UDP-GlcNAc:undecaprenyl-phosphate/decaprenyl-phosphate GlcNAc-1-phosphate transferase